MLSLGIKYSGDLICAESYCAWDAELRYAYSYHI